MSLLVTSSAFSEGRPIPVRFTCDGDDVSPALEWSNVPEGTRSIALVVDDPDAPGGTWSHWVLYGLPPDTAALDEAVPANESSAAGGGQGKNDFGKLGYGGPCPPEGHGPHRYYFKVYALDAEPEVGGGPERADMLEAIDGHILAEGQIMGTYERREITGYRGRGRGLRSA